jgi:hypothetical protein
MSDLETAIVLVDLLSAGIGLVLMQTKYRSYTYVERLSIAALIGALVLCASVHVLDGRTGGESTEAIISFAICFRVMTAALWRFGKCARCPVTIL